MADKKISALTAATTPLSGSEVLPIVQSGATVKVSVNNLTTGKPVTVSRLLADGAYDGNAPSTSSVPIVRVNEGGAVSLWISGRGYTNMWMQAIQDDGSNNLKELLLQPLGGPVTIGDGNLVIGTAGKGIDFSANTHAAGMTSELLNWYEEGNWTPTYSGWTTAPTNVHAKYTRVGRLVTLNYTGLDGVSVPGASEIGGLPFTSNSQQGASVLMKDVSGNNPGAYAFATVGANASAIQSMTAVTFTGLYWSFSVTYMV